MLTNADEQLFDGTWTLIQGNDPRDADELPKIVLRNGVAWYAVAPSAVGYYETESDTIAIVLPSGEDGLETITARVIGSGGMRKLTGNLSYAGGDREELCEPCVLTRSTVSLTPPAAARSLAGAFAS